MGTAYHVIESAVVYFRSVVPVVEETDARLLNASIEMGVMSLERLPKYFPELQPLADGRSAVAIKFSASEQAECASLIGTS